MAHDSEYTDHPQPTPRPKPGGVFDMTDFPDGSLRGRMADAVKASEDPAAKMHKPERDPNVKLGLKLGPPMSDAAQTAQDDIDAMTDEAIEIINTLRDSNKSRARIIVKLGKKISERDEKIAELTAEITERKEIHKEQVEIVLGRANEMAGLTESLQNQAHTIIQLQNENTVLRGTNSNLKDSLEEANQEYTSLRNRTQELETEHARLVGILRKLFTGTPPTVQEAKKDTVQEAKEDTVIGYGIAHLEHPDPTSSVIPYRLTHNGAVFRECSAAEGAMATLSEGTIGPSQLVMLVPVPNAEAAEIEPNE